MKFEKTDVWGFKHAIRGMRNPLESWEKSDSVDIGQICNIATGECKDVGLGENDLQLMQKLIKAGSEHRKFMRQIFVSVDITAGLFWWKEFETYKIGTTANSCSTMHKLADTPITLECFEMTDFENVKIDMTIKGFWEEYLIPTLEQLRLKYLETKDKRYWKELIRLLPESWLQKRTVTMNYENILNMYNQRKNHKLTEWSKDFIEWCESLPYFKELFND